MAISFLPLELTGESAEVGTYTVGGQGSFSLAGDGRSVVTEVKDGGVAGVVGSALEGDLAKEGSLLEVTVGYLPGWVVHRHQVVLNILRERTAPDMSVARRVKVHATHSSLAGIRSTQEQGLLGDNLCEVSWAVTETGGKTGKGVNVGTKVLGDTLTVAIGAGEGELERTEEAS